MQMTQSDYEDRKNREAAGNATDEDHRLIALYEQEGYECRGSNSEHSPGATPMTSEPGGNEDSSTAQTTEHLSKRGASKGSATVLSGEKSSDRTDTKS
jgi:hypothetical protein